MATANQVLNVARSYLGVTQFSTRHTELVNYYNSLKPLARSYTAKTSDDWCALFVSAIAYKAGAGHLVGREVGVERFIVDVFKPKGIWIEDEKQTPKPGDVIAWDWGGTQGWADHIGFVESVSNGWITTIEGNTNRRVARNKFRVGDARIRGYARPKYTNAGNVTNKSISELVAEVLQGLHGNGEARKISLGDKYDEVQAKINGTPAIEKSIDELAREVINGVHGNGVTRKASLGNQYDRVQERVNELSKQATEPAGETEIAITFGKYSLSQDNLNDLIEVGKKHGISVRFMVAHLAHESMLGASNVAKTDNNWGGFTYNAQTPSAVRPSGVTVTAGLKRPAHEGGNYMHFASVADYFKDYGYLLRQGGSYRVAGQTDFTQAVKGLFKVSGAKYDYAGENIAGNDLDASQKRFNIYVAKMHRVLDQLEKENGSLSVYDEMIFSKVDTEKVEVVESENTVTVVVDGITYIAKLDKKNG